MASTPSSGRSPAGGVNSILPYRMHVSQRYLDLTRQKLQLTRFPRDPRTHHQQWDLGVSKALIEPLIDHWSEEYDWRVQEAFYNEHLPQYRFAIHGTRMHFVHKRSMSLDAIPLLMVHGWPESFISVANIIDTLCNSAAASGQDDEKRPSFHVVAPSVPGCGFSDPVAEEGNNITTTAEAFDALMKSLGYARYIAHGIGWGFNVCRMIALMHAESCMAIHTSNPEVPPVRTNLNQSPHITPGMSTQIEVTGLITPFSRDIAQQQTPPQQHPQTIAYALCDSPVGLLAYVMDAVQPQLFPSDTQVTAWTPTTVLNWAMLHWLPGPEVALRWLANSAPMVTNLWMSHSTVPLAISQFGESGAQRQAPLWAEAYHRIAMVRRRPGYARFPSWERPEDVAQDLQDLATLMAPSFFTPYRAFTLGLEHQ